MEQITNPEQALAEDIGELSLDPVGFMRYAYPWEESELAASSGPRKWQTNILKTIGQHLQNEETRCTPIQIAVSSGHGIGKSALLGMIIDWAMSTCEDCKIVLTANTDTQLRTKTWPEVSKWFRLGINSNWFQVNSESITIKDELHHRSWRTDRISWSDNNTEAFAGLHNEGKRIVVIFDEASAISDKVWEVTEGALTDENTEIIWLAFGNPTQNTGRFRDCFGKFKHRWKTFQIDSRTVEGTNKAQIQKWADDWGEDSDFFRVRVRGEFPRAGSNQFIAGDIVAQARTYHAQGYESLPKAIACDVARFGDDQTVIGMRQGRKFQILAKLRGLDNVQVAFRVSEFIDSEKPDAVIVDGDGLGAGVVDQLKHRGYGAKLFEFHGGSTPNAVNTYYNKRAEVWGLCRDWLKDGAEIPDDPELEADLTAPTYGEAGGKAKAGTIILESKDDMKARGLPSPDLGDCLCMTFAVKVLAPPVERKVEYRYAGEGSGAWMA